MQNFVEFPEPASARNRLARETARVGARAASERSGMASSVMASPRGRCLLAARAPRMERKIVIVIVVIVIYCKYVEFTKNNTRVYNTKRSQITSK